MKILINYSRGNLIFDITSNKYVSDLIDLIANRIHVNSKSIQLFYDKERTKYINPKGKIINEHIETGKFLFMTVNEPLPEMTDSLKLLPADATSMYLDEGEEVPAELRHVKELYGNRTISMAHIQHKLSKLPKIVDQPDSSVYAIRVGEQAIKPFIDIATQTQFRTMRIAFLFGRIQKVTGKVTVHCLLEPPQRNEIDHVVIEPTFDITGPLAIAEMFQMECVGMAISFKPEKNYPMPERIVRMAALYQNLFSEYFTTLIVSPTESGEVEVQPFQVSDAAMIADRQQLFINSGDQKKCKFNKKIPMECGEGMRYIEEVDVNVFLVTTRIRKCKSRFTLHSFPSLSDYPANYTLQNHFATNMIYPQWYRFFDFNLLVYLENSGILNLEPEIRSIVYSILNQSDIDPEIVKKMTKLTGVSF